MTSEQLRSAHNAKPFKPFAIHLADGEVVEVSHPENLFLTKGGRTIVVNSYGEDMSIIDVLVVTRPTFQSDDNPKKSRRSA